MRRLRTAATAAAAVASGTAAAASLTEVAYADGVFSSFRRQPAAPPSPVPAPEPAAPAAAAPSGSDGFDPEDLERGARALREIKGSPYSKQAWSSHLYPNRDRSPF